MTEHEHWKPMKDAPKDRPIILRAMWAGEPIAWVGRWVSMHGTFCTLPAFGHDRHEIFATGWADLPPLNGAFA